MKGLSVSCILPLLVVFLANTALAAPAEHHVPRQEATPTLAPMSLPSQSELAIPDQFAVKLKEGYSLEAHWAFIGTDLSKTALHFAAMYAGFYFVKLSDPSIIDAKIRTDPGVILVEQDELLSFKPEEPQGDPFLLSDININAQEPQDGRQLWTKDGYWFDAMISAGDKLPTPISDHSNDYYMMSNPTPAEGINVYVIDTGVMTDHVAFRTDGSDQKRASNFQGLKDSDPSPFCDETMQDTQGHGTHVAGIIAGGVVGVAPRANIISVKALGKGASYERLAEAITAVTKEHIQNRDNKVPGFKGSVINMSLGSPNHKVLEAACDFASDNGIPIAAAAGNANRPVNDDPLPAPCKYHSVWCVGSVDRNYDRSRFSNWGREVNTFGPGTDIISASPFGGLDKFVSMSGTSMATPFVAGMLATFVAVDGSRWGEGVYRTSAANSIWRAIGNMPWGEATVNRLATTGINNPNKDPKEPFAHYYTAMTDKPAEPPTCTIDLTQIWTCEDSAANLYARFTVKDAQGKQLFATGQSTRTPGVPIDDNKDRPNQGYIADGADMYMPLQVIGEHVKDYIQFYYGSQAFTTGDVNSCKLTTDDWNKDGPGECSNGAQSRGFQCHFSC